MSHWIDQPDKTKNFGHDPQIMMNLAMGDLDDLDAAEILVMFCDCETPSEGKRVEWGYMLLGRRLNGQTILVGVGSEPHHIFDFMADHWFKNVAELLDWTSSL